MPLKPINCNEAFDTELAMESVRSDFVLLQVLRSCETLRTDLTNIVPVSYTHLTLPTIYSV